MNEPAPPIADTHPRPVPAAEGLAPGSIADWLAWAQRELSEASDSPQADAETLLAALLGIERGQLPANRGNPLEAATVLRFASWLERRKSGEPVAYITGRQGFWTLDLAVDSSVLIPRPDTETLVEWALAILKQSVKTSTARAPRIADLGTGSGAIALALAQAHPEAAIVATDISADALELAGVNARAHGIGNVEFRGGRWLEALDAATAEFDLIVSNPPYIAEGDAHLAALRYEPRLALTAGADGLGAIREIVAAAPAYLGPSAWLLLEHGHDQGAAVRGLMQGAGFVDVTTRADFGGNERVSGGRQP